MLDLEVRAVGGQRITHVSRLRVASSFPPGRQEQPPASRFVNFGRSTADSSFVQSARGLQSEHLPLSKSKLVTGKRKFSTLFRIRSSDGVSSCGDQDEEALRETEGGQEMVVFVKELGVMANVVVNMERGTVDDLRSQLRRSGVPPEYMARLFVRYQPLKSKPPPPFETRDRF